MKDQRLTSSVPPVSPPLPPKLVAVARPIPGGASAEVQKRLFTPWHFAAICAALVASGLLGGLVVLIALPKHQQPPEGIGESKSLQFEGTDSQRFDRPKLRTPSRMEGGKSVEPESWAPEEKASIGHFCRAWRALSAKDSLIQRLMPTRLKNGVLVPTVEEQNQIDLYTSLAFSEASLVQADQLGKAHPDLPRVFRTGLLRYLELGVKPRLDPNESKEAVIALRLWYDWIEVHEKDLRIPSDVSK